MKKIIVLIVVLIAVFGCSEKNIKNDLSSYGLRGKVKTCFVRYYEPEKKFGEWDTTKLSCYQDSEMVTFDKNGNIQTIEYYEGDYELKGKVVFKYANGLKTEQISYDGDGRLEEKVISEYLGDTLIKQTSYDEKNEIFIKTTYDYLSDSIVLECSSCGTPYENTKRISKIFLKDGNKAMEIVRFYYENKIDLRDSVRYHYDANGLLGLVESFTEHEEPLLFQNGTKDTTTHRSEYMEYDKKGNWTQKLFYVYRSSNLDYNKERLQNYVSRKIAYY